MSQAESGPSTKLSERQAYINTVIFGASFFLIYTATETARNYLSVMFGRVGQYYQGSFSVVVGVMGVFAPFFLHYFRLKPSIHLSSILCLIYIGLIMGALFVWEGVDKEYLPAGALVMGLIGAILYGIGTCIFYVAYSLYMDSITNPKTRGILVGVFFGIFNFCAPVGNLLAGILNQTSLNQSIIQLIFAVIAFVGVIVLIPIKTGEMNEDRYLTFKPYFKEMFEIAKIPRYYAVALSSVFNMCMVNFLASVFTGQVPEDTARTFTGYAFAMAGVMQIIGSFTWGVIIDKKSKRASFFISALLIQLFIIFANTTLFTEFESKSRLAMFCLTFIVYGSAGSSNDINQFWLTWDTIDSKNNPVIFVQYCRLLGGLSSGILSFTSAAGAPYPQYYILTMIVIAILYILGVWFLDIHYADMGHISKKNDDDEGEKDGKRKVKGKGKKKKKKTKSKPQEKENEEEGLVKHDQIEQSNDGKEQEEEKQEKNEKDLNEGNLEQEQEHLAAVEDD